MQSPRALVGALLLLTAPLVSAQAPPGQPPEVAQWAIMDGVPLELDDNETRAALDGVRAAISGQRIHDCVYDITMDVPNSYRVMGTPTQEMFLQKYGGVFSDLGLASARQEFPEGGPGVGIDPPEQLQGGTNLVGVLPGTSLDRWVVMGAHYDTRELTLGGGALDNAAGLCTVLELATVTKQYVDLNGPLRASMVFVWYDGEEWGLYGSQFFAKDTTIPADLLELDPSVRPTILVSQSYDMPGLNYPAKNMWVQYGDPTTIDEYAVLNLRTAPIHLGEEWTCWSYGCYEDLKARDDIDEIVARNTQYQFLVREIAYDLLACPPDFCWVYDDHYGRSDHIPLIANGSAGMRIQGSHDEEYPHYHQPTDSLPGIYAITGGSPDGIVAGFEMEAEAGGLVAFYVALQGFLGHYGYLFDPELGPVTVEPTIIGPDDSAAPTPGLAFGLVGLAAAGAALWVRRRQD